ncbi:MAG: VWA domain-containing protein, partial [Dehalococcoidia bacterium]
MFRYLRLPAFLGLALLAALFIAALAHVPQDRQAQAQPLPVGDIVFMIDESGSMDEDIADVQANVNNIASQLGASVDFQLGLVGFGAFDGHHGTTYSGESHIHTALTSDVGAFSTAVGELVDNGSFEPGFQATVLGMSNAMGFRAGAGVCGILITDEDADIEAYAPETKADALAALNSRNAALIAIVDGTSGSTAADYGPNAGSLAGRSTLDLARLAY